MRRAILILSLCALPLAVWADETKPAPATPAPDAAADAAVTPAPAPAPTEEAKPAPVVASKPVLKVVEAKPVDEAAKASKTDPIPDDPEEVILLIEQLINAAKGGNWQLFVGLLLTLLVWILRKVNVIAFLPDKAVPWVSAAIGMVGFMGVALASGLDLTTALIQGFLTGAAAVGLWELLGKHFLPKPKKAEAKS